MGLSQLNGGSVQVLGGVPGNRKSGVPGPQLGYMPQELALNGKFTIKETVQYFGKIYGIPNIKERFDKLIEYFELPDKNRFIQGCSGGEQRCVSIILSILHGPRLLVLDEPVVGMDAILRHKMWELLKDISESTNTAIIITSHYTEEAQQAHTVGFLRHGKLLVENSTENILDSLQLDNLQNALAQLCAEDGENSVRIINNEGNADTSELSFSTPQKSVSGVVRWKSLCSRNILMMCRSKL